MATDLSSAPPRRRSALWVAVAVGVLISGVVVILATREPALTRLADSPLVGRPAPQFRAATIDGTAYALDSDRGRWVVVNFFATWCVPCREEHSELVEFQARHAKTGDATVIGVVYDDDADEVREFRATEGGEWPMVVDPKGRLAIEFGVRGVPESYLIAPNGVIAAKIVGGVRAERLEAILREARGRV